MNRYFPVYAAILGVLALLLFLSPQIAAFISADSDLAGAELLKNTDFKNQKLDDRVWSYNFADKTNSVKIIKDALQIDNSFSKDNFSLVAQRLTLSNNKIYELDMNFDWQNNQSSQDVASFGVMKRGLGSMVALVMPLSNTGSKTETKKYFKANDSFQDPYLYVLVEGTGSFTISSLSLKEYDSAPSGAELEDSYSSQFLPIEILSIASGAISAAVSSQTPAASFTPIADPSASVSVSNTPSLLQTVSSEIVAYPGWSVSYSSQDISSELFTKLGLSVFQMFGGTWYKSSDDSSKFTLRSKGGIYIYNPTGETKKIGLTKAPSPSKLNTGKKWNLLVNSSDKEIKADSDFELDGQTSKFIDLIKNNKISSEIYVLSSTQTGVEMRSLGKAQTHSLDQPIEPIPAKSVFWLYIL